MKIKYKDSYGDVCRIENVVEKINGKLEEFGRRVKDGGGVKEKEGCSGGELDGVVG
jgi:hypothetical protein